MLSPHLLLVITVVAPLLLVVASALKKDGCFEKDEDKSIPQNYKTCHRYEALNETIWPKTEELPKSSKCAPGYYEKCLPCPLGYYKKNTKNTPCYLCKSGSGTPDDRAKWCTKLCKAGTRLQEDGKKRTRKCAPCEKGFYQPYSNLDYKCVPCPHNTVTAKTGSQSINDCFLNCPPGQHPNRDSTGCVPCPEGTYKPDFGPKTCTICSKNKTTAEDGATDSTQCIKPCEPGREYNKTSDNCDIKCGRGTFKGEFSSRSKCRPCPLNFAPNRRKAATTCIPNCGPGYEINGNQDNCTACGFGFVKTVTGNVPCQSCPGSQMTLTKATKNSGECQDFHDCAKPLSQKLEVFFDELQGLFAESESFIDAMVYTCRLGATESLVELLEEVITSFQTCGVLGQLNLVDIEIGGKTYTKEHYLEIFRTAYGHGGMCNFVHCLNNVAPEVQMSKTWVLNNNPCPATQDNCFCSASNRALATSLHHHLQLCPALQFHPEFLEVNIGGKEMIDSFLVATDVPTFCALSKSCLRVDCGNGTCSSLVSGDYECRCRFGYTGEHCQNIQDPLKETEPDTISNGVPTSTIVPTLRDPTEQPRCPTCEQCQQCPPTEPCPQCPVPACPDCHVTSCPTSEPCQIPVCPECPTFACPTSEPCPQCPVISCQTSQTCPIPSCPECPVPSCPTSEPCPTAIPCPQCPTPEHPTSEPYPECPVPACPSTEPCPDCPIPTEPPTCPTSSSCHECPKTLEPLTCQPCVPCPECTTLPTTTSEPCPACPQKSDPEPCATTSSPSSCPACPEPPTPPVCPSSTPCPECPTSSESPAIPPTTACPVCPEHPSTSSSTCAPCPECPTTQEPIPCSTSAPCPDCPKLTCPACPTCHTCPTTTEPPLCPACATCPASTPCPTDLGTTIIVCEDASETISCSRPGEVIIIKYANYGRTSPDTTICPHTSISDTNCGTGDKNDQVLVINLCDRQTSCELYASNSVFGDPCQGTYKYLEVTYRCVTTA